MALCPFARHKLIAPGSSDPRITARAVVLHVDAGNALSLFSFFRDRSGGIESHFHITLLGRIEQYRDTAWQADANFHANDFAISIETQGFGGGWWTKRQKKAIERLLLWLNEAHDIPLRRIPAWDSSGVGYHVMWGAPGPWTPVSKSCPGTFRIRQFNRWLVPWMASNPTEEFTVNEKDAKLIRQIVREEVGAVLDEDMNVRDPRGDKRFRGKSLRTLLKEVWLSTKGTNA